MGFEKSIIFNKDVFLSKAYFNFDIKAISKQNRVCRVSIKAYKSYEDYLAGIYPLTIFRQEFAITDEDFDKYVDIIYKDGTRNNLFKSIYKYLKTLPDFKDAIDVLEGE